MTARILVVDDDPWTQRMVSAVLSHAGHAVDLASDEWEGLIMAGRARPDLVITETTLPTGSGWSFVESLRSRPSATRIPVLFLAAAGSDMTPGRSFQPGIDGWLHKPFRLDQIEESVTRALSHDRHGTLPSRPRVETAPVPVPATPTPRPVSPATDKPVLTGQLSEFGLSSLLIVLELERKSGEVLLRGPRGSGHVFLRGGRVIRAQIEDPEKRGGAMAVYDLLAWTKGDFEFRAGSVEGEDEIGSSTSYLLMEGARLQDEQGQSAPKN